MKNETNRFAARWMARALGRGLAAGLALGIAATAAAQSLQPIEMIVPFGVGGGADQLARYSAQLLQAEVQAPITVTNVAGATGNDGIAKLLAAPSDGRMVALLTADTYATLAYANPRWNPADVVPLAILTRQTSALFVAAPGRFASWHDFESEARARPRALRVAISGLGSPDYIALQQLAAKNIQLTPLPLANPQERYQAVLDGRADALYEQPGDVRSFIDAGQLRPILNFGGATGASNGVANGASNGASNGGVPTSSELGLGSGLAQFRAIVVKAGTDPRIVSALAEACARVAASAEFKAFLQSQLAAADSFAAADAARGLMQRELAQMKQVVDALPLHARHVYEDKAPQVQAPTF